MSDSAHAESQPLDSTTATTSTATDLSRQHEAALAALQRLLDLGSLARNAEAQLRRELVSTQEALRTRTSDVGRLQAEVAVLREQATKREQAERTEEDTRQRLLQVERYIAVLTGEQENRREAEKARADEQLHANESLRAELASSLAKAREREALVRQLEDKHAELTHDLQDSQQRLTDTEARLSAWETDLEKQLADLEKQGASREEKILQLQRQLAEKAEAEQRLIADASQQQATLEAEVQRLGQEVAKHQAPGRFSLADANKRLADMVSDAYEPGHSELVGRLTQERDAALHEHHRLLAKVRELALLPAGSPSPFMTGVAPLTTRWKNPLVNFLEPTLIRLVSSHEVNDNIRLFAVLCAQGRIQAMLTHTPGQAAEASSAHMVGYVFQCFQQYEAFFPAEARVWAADHKGILMVLESWVTTVVKRQLARVLTAAGP